MPIINMVYKKKKWWKPWANTLIYYNFEDNINDQSWNSRNATSGWTISYWTTTQGKKYINLSSWWLVFPNLSYSTPTTFAVRFKQNSSSGDDWVFDMSTWWWDGVIMRVRWTQFATRYPNWWTSKSVSFGTSWSLAVVSCSSSWINYYMNWNSTAVWTTTAWNSTYTASWSRIWTEWQSNYERNQDLYVWSFIIENKAWTVDDYINYYNLTKSNYWL